MHVCTCISLRVRACVRVCGRYWLYRGANDVCYKVGSVDHAADFFQSLGGRVNFVNSTVPSLHAIPTLSDGTACGTEGNYTQRYPHGLEACDYDGAGHCLSHMCGPLRPPVPQRDGGLSMFDQREFDVPRAGLDVTGGFLYVPESCDHRFVTALPDVRVKCTLHIFLHGCGMSAASPSGTYAFNDTYARRAGFNEWAESNNIVILYPQLHYGTHRATCASEADDCWDQGGSTGDSFADKGGAQMTALKSMIDRLSADPGHQF
eukprot:m.208168 g.208168  ORF g.208168 m.208168 type:complete len:262 (+) comp24038_c0_seq1:123-908(+)